MLDKAKLKHTSWNVHKITQRDRKISGLFKKKKINKTRSTTREVRVEGKVRYIVIMIPVYRNTISESDVITMLIL